MIPAKFSFRAAFYVPVLLADGRHRTEAVASTRGLIQTTLIYAVFIF